MMRCPANDVADPTKDMMWFFLMQGGQRANIPALKEAVNDLCHATMQKNAGQEPYAKKTDINWSRDMDSIMWRIVMEATALVLSGKLDELEDAE